MEKNQVAFTINVCITDASFVEKTLRHMTRALKFPFVERMAVLDSGEPRGRYQSSSRGHLLEDLRGILDRLIEDDVLDRVEEIPWEPASVERTLSRYFAGASAPGSYAANGSPVYQYLYALELCRTRYALHVEPDILFYQEAGTCWIDEGISFLAANPQAVMMTPAAGPPTPDNLLEHLLSRRVRFGPAPRWQRNADVSTRYFLCDLERLKAALPIEQARLGEPLEQSLTHTLRLKGLESWCLTEEDSWAIHVLRHDEGFLRHVDDLIAAVEAGVYPFVRGGDRWDLLTDGDSLGRWLKVIARARARGWRSVPRAVGSTGHFQDTKANTI